VCAPRLVSKTAFCITFEGFALLSKGESKIDEEHTLSSSCQEGSQTEPQSHPAPERPDEILGWPREREADLSPTAVTTQHSSV